MHMLKDERLQQHQPTQYPTSEELQMGGITFKAFDLGGHKVRTVKYRSLSSRISAPPRVPACCTTPTPHPTCPLSPFTLHVRSRRPHAYCRAFHLSIYTLYSCSPFVDRPSRVA